MANRVSSVDLEGQLSLSPPSELALFAARDRFDVIVIYDRASTSIPNAPPPSTSSDAQRALWNLTAAIYDHEFRKSLKRQPVLLKGGWEAWQREVGSKGIVREGEEPPREDLERAEAKKANRRTAVMQVGLGGPAVVRNGAGSVSPSRLRVLLGKLTVACRFLWDLRTRRRAATRPGTSRLHRSTTPRATPRLWAARSCLLDSPCLLPPSNAQDRTQVSSPTLPRHRPPDLRTHNHTSTASPILPLPPTAPRHRHHPFLEPAVNSGTFTPSLRNPTPPTTPPAPPSTTLSSDPPPLPPPPAQHTPPPHLSHSPSLGHLRSSPRRFGATRPSPSPVRTPPARRASSSATTRLGTTRLALLG